MANTGWQNSPIDPNAVLASFEVEGWDRENNNLSLIVPLKVGENTTDVVYEIKFPEEGKAPKMIAVDPSVDWMVERQHVPGGTDGWYY